MMYTSTRDRSVTASAAQAITQGISNEGGLFVPEQLPQFTKDELAAMVSQSYIDRAVTVLSRFLTDFTADEVRDCAQSAYGSGRFLAPEVAPVHSLKDGVHVLELWHGPTCAFKDMALQILPHLMRVSASKTSDGKEIVILVATSGDTGKAALEGFRDAPHTRILVFYPENGVSPMQKLQMTTQEGGNVGVCAIRGNFDDAQSGVKTIFTDPTMRTVLAEQGMMFSSANSINWGRLVPQIVYYFSAYCDLVAAGSIAMGDPVNVAVPTGNFGNILAAYYAREMGLPVARLICASNCNNVLTDFLRTGTYDRRRAFHTTISPSMDILISSNLERLLYHLSGCDAELVAGLMKELNETGSYTVPAALMEKLRSLFAAGWCDDEQTMQAIRTTYEQQGYLCDTHTAVAVSVCEQYRAETGDNTPIVLASTADPYKFSASVLRALGAERDDEDEFDKVDRLHALTGAPVPPSLAVLKGKQPRFTQVCDRDTMEQTVRALLAVK
ncbi:MAG: threonine synthase [Clostridia bacterium]|nr:threonine synthase [Clostridia bacterium]